MQRCQRDLQLPEPNVKTEAQIFKSLNSSVWSKPTKGASLLLLLAHREDDNTVLLSAPLLAKMTKDNAAYLTCSVMLMNHEGFWHGLQHTISMSGF